MPLIVAVTPVTELPRSSAALIAVRSAAWPLPTLIEAVDVTAGLKQEG